jgi:hypothetical protein
VLHGLGMRIASQGTAYANRSRRAGRHGECVTTKLAFVGNPAISVTRCVPETGGFASPSRDGYALDVSSNLRASTNYMKPRFDVTRLRFHKMRRVFDGSRIADDDALRLAVDASRHGRRAQTFDVVVRAHGLRMQVS